MPKLALDRLLLTGARHDAGYNDERPPGPGRPLAALRLDRSL
jgi:hypothetical protein